MSNCAPFRRCVAVARRRRRRWQRSRVSRRCVAVARRRRRRWHSRDTDLHSSISCRHVQQQRARVVAVNNRCNEYLIAQAATSRAFDVFIIHGTNGVQGHGAFSPERVIKSEEFIDGSFTCARVKYCGTWKTSLDYNPMVQFYFSNDRAFHS